MSSTSTSLPEALQANQDGRAASTPNVFNVWEIQSMHAANQLRLQQLLVGSLASHMSIPQLDAIPRAAAGNTLSGRPESGRWSGHCKPSSTAQQPRDHRLLSEPLNVVSLKTQPSLQPSAGRRRARSGVRTRFAGRLPRVSPEPPAPLLRPLSGLDGMLHGAAVPSGSDWANSLSASAASHGFKGVSRSGLYGRWRAQICLEGRTLHLGTYPGAEEAARAWDMAAIKARGRLALTNFDITSYFDGTADPQPESEPIKPNTRTTSEECVQRKRKHSHVVHQDACKRINIAELTHTADAPTPASEPVHLGSMYFHELLSLCSAAEKIH